VPKGTLSCLKTKGNTPKYGLIYHSTFIGRADAKNKGRISRYLANKCSIATRIDSFSDEPSRLYGEKLRDQVEERLKFYETGQAPRRNIDVMEEVSKVIKAGKGEVSDEEMDDADEKKKAKKDKKKRKSDAAMEIDDDDEEEVSPKKSAKKAKKEDKESSLKESRGQERGCCRGCLQRKRRRKRKKERSPRVGW
jgi:nucleolar protein 56